MKQISSVLLSLALAFGLLSPMVSATEITTAGGTNEVPMELTQEPTAFSVTVPTVLPVDISANGEVTVATDNKIINNSFGPIEVKGIEIVSLNDWVLQDFETDFKTKKVGIKEYGFQMNGENVATNGNCSADSFEPILGKNEISFSYNANVASQNTAYDKEQIAQVVFTVGWLEDNSLVAGLYDSNGVLLCSWEDSGIDIEKDYTYNNFGDIPTSGYYVLKNNYPTATKVVIPNNITKIGNCVFYAYDGVTSIEIPNSVTEIGSYAFCGMETLTSIIIPNSVVSLGEYAFTGCTNLAFADIGNGVQQIGKDTFIRCTNLEKVIIGSSVSSIGTTAFSQCSSLSDIFYRGSEEDWAEITKGSSWDRNSGSYTVTYNYKG